MRAAAAAIALVLAASIATAGQDPPLMCFGTEPSWSLALATPGVARLAMPDAPPVEYRGSDTPLAHLRERVWRGAPAGEPGSVLVAFLRDGECSDGMSDVRHPVTVRVSLADGRFLAGCCRLVSTPASAIEGPSWRLTRLLGADGTALPDQPQVSVRFDAGRVSGFGGCNRLAGSYTLDGDRLTLAPLAATMMACPPPAGSIETAFKEAFRGTLGARVVEGRLVLAGESRANPELVFEAAPEPRLEGVVWHVTGFNNGRQAVVSPLVGTTLTVEFRDGAVGGHAGCNTFRARYTREGNRLRVGAATATRKHCAGAGVMEQERQFLAAIESATTWAIDERGMLDVHRDDGERVLFAGPSAP